MKMRPQQVMKLLDSASNWTSQDPLSSTTCFLFSENDQKQDDFSSEVSSEGDVEAGLGKHSPSPLTTELAKSPEAYSVCEDQQASTAERDQTGHSHRTPPYSTLTSASTARPQTEGDSAFTRKCVELQGYVRPLLELLNGLKTGRFDKGLSTFQQSVAMDRLQRIVGLLQKPYMGEKYLRTLLQVEMMLKAWFPRVIPCGTKSTQMSLNCTTSPPLRWHQNQLPVKKRRLSWSDSESLSPGPPNCKHSRDKEPERSPKLTCSVLTNQGASSAGQQNVDACSRNQGPVMSESEGGSCSDTQDCSISSTTSTSELCQTPGEKEVAASSHTHDQVQNVLGEGQKKRADIGE
ncbi:circadian associated repressor of transcription a isoform X2 [Hoplias malabaricus]|uniref:circadian associated repressor of transcription a isoform X2 n=1 Tax=Hoplias malabaricus TaxID=27720 RepID=UPI0034628AA9